MSCRAPLFVTTCNGHDSHCFHFVSSIPSIALSIFGDQPWNNQHQLSVSINMQKDASTNSASGVFPSNTVRKSADTCAGQKNTTEGSHPPAIYRRFSEFAELVNIRRFIHEPLGHPHLSQARLHSHYVWQHRSEVTNPPSRPRRRAECHPAGRKAVAMPRRCWSEPS